MRRTKRRNGYSVFVMASSLHFRTSLSTSRSWFQLKFKLKLKMIISLRYVPAVVFHFASSLIISISVPTHARTHTLLPISASSIALLQSIFLIFYYRLSLFVPIPQAWSRCADSYIDIKRSQEAEATVAEKAAARTSGNVRQYTSEQCQRCRSQADC